MRLPPSVTRSDWCRDWPAIRYEFGPWWVRSRFWVQGGRWHHVWTGEPCVVFPARLAALSTPEATNV